MPVELGIMTWHRLKIEIETGILKMKEDIQKSLEIYQEQLRNGYIQTAYIALTKYAAELKGKFPEDYSTSNIGFGYLDYTYFYFVNDALKNKNLKFALVLNHEEMRFELWLCARTAAIQRQYWNLLKDSKWNQNVEEMPKYSVLEDILETKIDFNAKGEMTLNIIDHAVSSALEIEAYLQTLDC